MTAFLDLRVLRSLEIDLDDLDLVQETVKVYLDELPARSDQITAAATQGDLDALRFGSHKLGSASALVGAVELHRLCRQLELRDDVDDPAVRRDLLETWPDTCTATAGALRSWLTHGSKR